MALHGRIVQPHVHIAGHHRQPAAGARQRVRCDAKPVAAEPARPDTEAAKPKRLPLSPRWAGAAQVAVAKAIAETPARAAARRACPCTANHLPARPAAPRDRRYAGPLAIGTPAARSRKPASGPAWPIPAPMKAEAPAPVQPCARQPAPHDPPPAPHRRPTAPSRPAAGAGGGPCGGRTDVNGKRSA